MAKPPRPSSPAPAAPEPPPAPKRRGRISRFAEKQELIITAATEILNERGLKGITLAAVAKKTGLIVQGVGYYFPKKDDLAAACILRTIGRYDALVEAAAAESTAEDRIRRFITTYFEALRRSRTGEDPALAALDDIRALNEENLEKVLAALLAMFRRLRSYFTAPGLGWMTRQEQTARTALLLQMAFSAQLWAHSRLAEDYARGAERLLDIAFHGLAPDGTTTWNPPELAFAGATEVEAERDVYLIAATRLINEEGYKGASVEKIAARLNLSKGAFYHHNEAKDDVVMRCFDRTFELISRTQAAAARLAGTEWDRLGAISRALVNAQFSDAGPLLRTTAVSALPPEMKFEMVSEWTRVANRFAAMISDGIADGSVRATDARIAAEQLMAAINSSSELPRWLPDIETGRIPLLYLRPLFLGLLTR